VRWTGSKWVERCVASEGGRFEWCDATIWDSALRERLASIPLPLADGYECEVNLAASEWIAAVAGKLRRGWILAIDYGYPRAELYRPERTAGTLSAYAGHQRETDPLARPGEVDLTAHVDFTSLAERAIREGLRLDGWTDQHHFMVGLSRMHFIDEAAITPARAQELRAFQTLMHPTFLGTSFRVICFSRGVPAEPPLSGFSFAADSQRALGLEGSLP
jgi:SAM-dependent MidA family methyltransferase